MPGGRPPKYRSRKQIEEKIEKYFEECEGIQAKDEKGMPLFSKFGAPCYIKQPKPPTVTGLALALGFTSRQALLNYQAKEEFVDTITRAKSRIEQYTEERLFDRDGANGAKFSLANNFRGWNAQNSQRMEEGDGVDVINDAPEETDQDIGDHNSEVPEDT